MGALTEKLAICCNRRARGTSCPVSFAFGMNCWKSDKIANRSLCRRETTATTAFSMCDYPRRSRRFVYRKTLYAIRYSHHVHFRFCLFRGQQSFALTKCSNQGQSGQFLITRSSSWNQFYRIAEIVIRLSAWFARYISAFDLAEKSPVRELCRSNIFLGFIIII